MAKATFKSETELGPPVIAWLEEHRWEVYQEVESPVSGRVADIVATLGTMVAVVELKRSLSFEVVAQALDWRRLANWIWVAVPYQSLGTEGRRLGISYLHEQGIGVMICHPSRLLGPATADVRHHPHLMRHADVAKLRESLRPEHKTFAVAGAAHGRHWSAFKDTCEKIRAYLVEHDGAEVGAVIGAIKHHYPHDRSARASLMKWADRGSIEGVKLVREGGRCRFYVDALPEVEHLEPCDGCTTPSKLPPSDGHARFCDTCKALLGHRKDT